MVMPPPVLAGSHPMATVDEERIEFPTGMLLLEPTLLFETGLRRTEFLEFLIKPPIIS